MFTNLWRRIHGWRSVGGLRRLRASRKSRRLFMEPLENRSLLATIVVTGTGDSVAVDGLVTLREAITAASTNAAAGDAPAGDAGLDTINFDIPASDPNCNATTHVCTISPAAALPTITEVVNIDGGNGGVATNRVQISGGGTLNTGLNVSGSNVQIRNLVINGFTSREIIVTGGSGQVIQGNFLGLDPTGATAVASSGTGVEVCGFCGASNVQIGGATAATRNVITASNFNSGINIEASAATIQGNFIGLNAAGTAHLGDLNGISLLNASATIGGTSAGARNVIVGFTGISFSGNPAFGRSSGTVQGNFIGTDVTGTVALNLGNGPGIDVVHGSGVVISGGNVISGNGAGVTISSSGVSGQSSNSTTVQGNLIGTAADGVAALGNTRDGVSIGSSSNNRVGGTNSGEGNVIAFNGRRGVFVSGGTGNAVLGNSIFGNGKLGIDFAGGKVDPITHQTNEDPITGVTPNDPGDDAPGPSDPPNPQNFPVITAVSSAGGNTTITGTLNSVPSTTFRIEFYANDVADLSSFGEGKTLLGFKNFTTDASGNAPISATLPVTTTPSQFITATATRLDESNLPVETSEFSQLIADLALSMSDSPDPVAALQDLVYSLSLTNSSASSPSGPVTLTDTLPDNVTFVSATTSQGTFTPAGNTVTFDLGTLAIGGSVTATITVRPTAAAAGTTLNNSATVTSVVSDPNAANNSDSEATAVTAAAAPQTDLQVTKSASPNAAVAGTDLTYTITVTNAGPSDAESVSLSDVLPTGTTFVSAGQTSGPTFSLAKPPVGGGGTLAATASTLAAGASASFTLVVHVNASTPDDTTLNNTATVTTTTPDTNTANNSSTESTGVNTEADLRVTKSAGSSVVTAGGNVTYTITLTNLGPSDAQSASISDVLPTGTTFVSFATPGGFTAATPAVNGTGTVTASAAVLAAGQSAAFQLVVGVGSGTAAGTSVTNTADASTATADTNLANNSAFATVQVETPVAPSALTISLVSRQAKFRNEFGLFIVDDASGRIGNLLPGAAGYARAALARAKVVFAANTKLGTSRTVNLPAGSSYGLYLIQNANKAQFLARNPTNRLSGKLPLMFFSFRAANPDGFEHLGRPSPTQFAFEDMTNGGDQDFNDVIVDIRAQSAAPALQSSVRLSRWR